MPSITAKPKRVGSEPCCENALQFDWATGPKEARAGTWTIIVLVGALTLVALVLGAGCTPPPQRSPMISQYPSPMDERARAHQRVPESPVSGVRFSISGILDRPIEVYLPPVIPESVGLVIHFHGSAFIPVQAVAAMKPSRVVAVVNLGSGSSAYERPFVDAGSFSGLLDTISDSLAARTEHQPDWRSITITSFSAGYGAIRAFLKDSSSVSLIDTIILIDGLHASYVPERVVLAAGGHIDSLQMAPFVEFASLAAAGKKSFLVVHSEIFPGTYASTTETADFLLERIGIQRRPVLLWGSKGMQQLSVASLGRFTVKGFAGNSAPDHVDQFHAYESWLESIGDRN